MKQKREIAVLVVLMVIAVGIWFFYFQRDRQVVTADDSSAVQNYQLLSVENPHIRVEKLEGPRKTEYKTLGRNIFSTVAPPPPVAPKPTKPEPSGPKVLPPEPPPPAPQIPPNMKFFGYGAGPDSPVRRAFFTDGEEVYIVAEGEVFMNRFRIIKINNTSLEFEEISSGRRGTAQLEEQGAAAAPQS